VRKEEGKTGGGGMYAMILKMEMPQSLYRKKELGPKNSAVSGNLLGQIWSHCSQMAVTVA